MYKSPLRNSPAGFNVQSDIYSMCTNDLYTNIQNNTTTGSEDPDYPYDSANPSAGLSADSQRTPGHSTAVSQYDLAQPVAGLTDSMPESDVTHTWPITLCPSNVRGYSLCTMKLLL